MRIKSVLRDKDILNMEEGSEERITATVSKNFDRAVNINSLLRVMGMDAEQRIDLLRALGKKPYHIWLANQGNQHVIYISEAEKPQDEEIVGYMWQ